MSIFLRCQNRVKLIRNVWSFLLSFTLAFQRHCSVFGVPETVNSDNGANFVRTEDQLQALQRFWDDQ